MRWQPVAQSEEAAMARVKRKTPWVLLPFTIFWNLIAYLVSLMGRLVAIGLGLALMALGVVISLTIVGAIVGVPLFAFGALLVIRGLW